ncbi:MAG: extracellular solute-binding protein [Spirochaetales bacterium]|jgi:iron(III) transport system substrate-binding protein|nr:extracellular solute-binding protein [Spirochaetales bacterium]
MTRKLIVGLLFCICLTGFAFAGGEKETPAQAPAAAPAPGPAAAPVVSGPVAFYANITSVDPLLEDFGKRTGIKAEYTRISTTKFLSTVFTEFEAGKLLADVIQAPLPVMEQLRAGGVLTPYISPSAQGYPDWAKRETEGIYMFGIEYVGLIYNKDLVKPADVPKAYKDLADPKWKNKIVMADPSIHPTTISWLVALKEHGFGNNDAQWRAFLAGLAANNPMLVASFGPTPAPLASGEKAIGISMPKYIITNAPAPLDWARIEPLMGSPRAMGVSAKAPHAEAAKKFVDYWLSKDAAAILANDVGEYVVAPGVFPPIDGMDKATVIPIEELSDADLIKWGAEFKKIFGIK